MQFAMLKNVYDHEIPQSQTTPRHHEERTLEHRQKCTHIYKSNNTIKVNQPAPKRDHCKTKICKKDKDVSYITKLRQKNKKNHIKGVQAHNKPTTAESPH